MGVTLAMVRGRAKQLPLLRLVRRWAAVSLARNLRPTVRWIPSERNVADAPSRLRELAGAGVCTLTEGVDPVADPRQDPDDAMLLVARAQERARRARPPARNPEYFDEEEEAAAGGRGKREAVPIALHAALSVPDAAPVPADRQPDADRQAVLPSAPEAQRLTTCPRHLRSTLHGLRVKRSRNGVVPATDGRYFADFYTEKLGVANAVSDRGYQVRQWTDTWGPRHDPVQRPVFRRILHDIMDKSTFGAHFGPHLGDGSRDRQVAQRCVRLVESLEAAGTPYVISQPLRSRLWESTRLKRFEGSPHIHVLEPDACQYGGRSRLRSRLWCSRLDPFGMESCGRQCTGRNGRCSRSGRAHLQLAGPGPRELPAGLCVQLGLRLTEGPRDAFMDSCSW